MPPPQEPDWTEILPDDAEDPAPFWRVVLPYGALFVVAVVAGVLAR